MTTPGDGNNEIELVIKPVIEDAEQAVRSEGERQAAAFREGVESVGAAQIRPPNTDELYRQYDSALLGLEQRAREAARNISFSLQEGITGTPLEYRQDQVRQAQIIARQQAQQAAATQADVQAEQDRVQATRDADRAARTAEVNARRAQQLRAAGVDPTPYMSGGGAPPPPPPRAPGAAGFPEDPRMTEAYARLQGLFQLTEAQVQAGRLTGFERGDVARAGSTLDGQTIVRGPGEDEFYRVKRGESGTLEQITQTDALSRATSDLALASKEAARSEELLAAAQERALLTGRESIGQLQLQAAIEKENAALAANNPGALASARIAKARAASAVDEEINPPASRNFLQAFSHGAFGGDKGDSGDNAHFRLNADNGEFLGAIARYQAAYAVIFGLSQAFHSVMTEEEQVQAAMVEFSEATGLAGDRADRLAAGLIDIGSRSGMAAAESIQAATRGAFAFGDETQNPDGTRNTDATARVAAASVQATAVAAFITDAKDASVAQGQLIAATRSFNLTAEDQSRVLDAAANAARHYGAATGDILQGLPGVAAIAHQAGLSVEETANIISIAAVRTAQTGTAVSTAIGRVLENINSKPQTKSLLDTFGIDTSGTAGHTLESLAHNWKSLTDAQKDQVVASLGGVRAAKDLIPVLEEGDGLIRSTRDSYQEAGFAQQKYYAQLNTLAGVLKTISGDISLVGHDLAGSHLFDLFGLALKTIDPFLVGLDDVLRLIGAVDFGHWLTPLLEIAAVTALIAKHMATIDVEQGIAATEAGTEAVATTRSGIGRLVPFGLGRGAVAGRELTTAEALGNPFTGTAAVGGEVAAGEAATATGGLAAMGGALIGPLGVVVGLIAMTTAVGAVTSAVRAESAARKDGEAAFKELRTATDAEGFRSAASALAAAAVKQDHANGGFGGFFATLANGEDRARPDILRHEAGFASNEADRLERQQAALSATGTNATDLYFGHTKDRVADLTNGLAAMAEAGVPAVRALELLNAQIGGLGSGPSSQPGVYGTETTVAGLVGSVTRDVQDFHVGRDDVRPLPGGVAPDRRHAYERQTASQLSDIPSDRIRNSITSVLQEAGIGAGDLIDVPTQKKIADSVIHSLGLDHVLSKQGQARLNQQIRDSLAQNFDRLSQTSTPLTADEANQIILGNNKSGKPAFAAVLSAQTAQVDPRQLDGSQSLLKQQIASLQLLARSATGQALQDDLVLLHKAEADYVTAEIARLDRLQQHAAGTANDPAALLENEARFTLAKAQVAIGNNDETALITLLDGASKATIDAVKKALEAEVLLQRAAHNSELAVWNSLPANLKRANAEDAPTGVDLHTAEHNLGAFTSALPNVTPADTPKQDPNALGLALINAKADSRDAVQSARVAVEAAQYTLDHAKNATERANAQKQLNDANNAYTAAVATNTQALRSAQVDPRDTLGAARTAVSNAKTALDATEKGTTAYYQALATYHSAQASYAQSQRQQAAAAAAANIRQGDPLAAATATLHSADAALQAELRGTVGWYNALGQFHQAQYAYGQALLAAQQEHRLLSIDATDPVKTAHADVQAAQATLARDRHNKTGDITADETALRDANTREEAARFSQRLSDVEFAHNVGRLSEQAYLAYLDSEHNRLSRITHRTRQQTEELQQIDSAIKAANDQLTGQFNLGDIKVPTVYEVRRTIALSAGGGAAVGGYQDNRQVSITINGNNLAQMTAVLDDHLGSASTTRVAISPRKGA